MSQQGSAGNVLAALASLFLPGLGQLLQGRLIAAVGFFVFSCVLWFVTFTLLGWVANVIAALEAAVYTNPDA
jgi:TM2 domain-containing membrane protein YozV